MANRTSSTIRRTGRAVCHQLTELELKAPFWQYRQMFAGEPYSFLLDSAQDPTKLGRFSFIGADPSLVYRAKRRLRPGQPAIARIETTRLHDADGHPLARPIVTTREADPFDDLRNVLAEFRIEHDAYADHPLPLLAGAVGYFGYEAGHYVEELPDRGHDDLDLPDVYFTFHDVLLGHCHQTGRSFLSVVGRGASDRAAQANAARARDATLARIEVFEAGSDGNDRQWHGPDAARAAATTLDVQAQFDRDSYCRLVDVCKQHIFAGDVFEVCLTHRLEAALTGPTWDLYRELRRINPAPFAAYLQFPEARVISASPERYLSLSAARIAESRPVKGTRRRGANEDEDHRVYQELLGSVKDRAENVMIVDLVRSDLGRVCRFGSIHVPELLIVEPYATVFQMVSTVRGELEPGRDALDVVRATFPGGSMTGAPKIEAMKIIDRLEPTKRGIYSGAIGYLDFAGTMDLSIVIRTYVARAGRCYFNVGGAIVADSVPRAEYDETLDKAQAMIRALKNLKACQ